jgi:hypothetical protein
MLLKSIGLKVYFIWFAHCVFKMLDPALKKMGRFYVKSIDLYLPLKK